MDDGNLNQPKEHSRFGINQNLVIALITAAATVLAALIPYWLSNRPQPTPEFTPIPTLVSPPTDTAVPSATSTSTALPTETLTPTPQLPTETPTPSTGIYDVYLAQDRGGTSKTNVFGPQQTVYVFFNLNDPSGSNSVEARWFAVDAKGFASNTVINSQIDVIYQSKDSFEMLFSPSWRQGRYKVELYLNGSLQATQEFEVR